MSRPSLHTTAPILLVGAAPSYEDMVNKTLPYVESVLAVDGGLAVCRAAGVRPQAVIGDLDSVSDTDLEWLGRDRVLAADDQNYTDLQKALRAVDAPVILGAGFLGGRLDHHMAAMTAILQDTRPVILVKEDEICLIAPPSLSLPLPIGTPIGFYPLVACRFTSTGVVYPLTDAVMAPDGLISTSNRVDADRVTVSTDRRAVLVTLPLVALGAVISALSPAP